MYRFVGLVIIGVLIGGCSVQDRKPAKLPAKTDAKEADVPVQKVAPKPQKVVPPKPTIGSGDYSNPAIGPAPVYDCGKDTKGYVLVKNWDFGKNGTVRNMTELTEHFQYHDQFGVISNGGGNYGALIVAATEKSALKSKKQPVDKKNTGGKPVREFFDDSIKTYLIPLNGAKQCHPKKYNVGCGSFQAKWTLPKGGSRLGYDILWETRVRYVTPPYFWFAIWTCGNKWNRGAEIDVVESFGYDNGGGYTNFDGRYWHVGIVGGREDIPYKNWNTSMTKMGVPKFDATKYHTWTMVYKADNTIQVYMDGILVQTGFSHWTLGTKPDGEELNMSFIFDGAWGHTKIASVNKPLPAKAFDGKFYEWDYSRIYLRKAVPAKK